MAKDNIFLTGFMGAGKSSVGQKLAHKTGWSFVDTDRFIETGQGASVQKIFDEKGEPHFRDLEKKAVAEVCRRREQVVSLGGGALLTGENLAHVLDSGVLVYLAATPETLAKRLHRAAQSRPLLKNHTGAERLKYIAELLKKREPVYQRAHFTVHTDNKQPAAIAAEILKLMGWSSS